jgi:hypothetical protein
MFVELLSTFRISDDYKLFSHRSNPFYIYNIPCVDKIYKQQLREDQMSRNNSSTIVAVIVVLLNFR